MYFHSLRVLFRAAEGIPGFSQRFPLLPARYGSNALIQSRMRNIAPCPHSRARRANNGGKRRRESKRSTD